MTIEVTHATVDALEPGDYVCEVSDTAGVTKVQKALPAVLAIYGRAYGMATQAAAAGGAAVIATSGLQPTIVHGLTGGPSKVRISTSARAEKVGSYSTGDFPGGYLDGNNRLSLHMAEAIGVVPGLANISDAITGLGGFFVAAGSSVAAAQSAVDAATAAWVSTGRQQSVIFGAGLHTWSAALNHKSGVKLVGYARGARITTSMTPAVGLADDPTNALILAQGVIGGSDFTTLSANARTGDTVLSTAAAPSVDAWYLLRSTGNSQTGYQGQSWHANTTIVRGEPVRVKTVTGSGPYTVTLYSPLKAWHGSTSSLRTLTPVQDIAIEGLDFRTEGGTIANHIFADGVVGLALDVAGSGTSRGIVNGRFCKGVSGKILNRGESNSPAFWESCPDTDIEYAYDPSSTLGKSHANGIARGVYYTASCANALIRGIIGRCTGLEFKGVHDSRFDVTLKDCDLTARVATDTTLFTGQGGNKVAGIAMNCSNPSSVETELPYNLTGSIRVHDCTVPDASTNGLQFGVLIVDSIKHDFDLIECVNHGRDPGLSGFYQNGLALYDSAAFDCFRLKCLRTIGVQHALVRYGGGNRFDIGRWEYTASAGLFAGTLGFGHGDTAAGTLNPARIRQWVCNDSPQFFIYDHAGSTGVNHDTLRDLQIDRLELANGGVHDEVHVCLDVDVATPAAGDFVEIVPPRAATLVNATDTFTLTGHGLLANTPIYLGGTTLPGGYTAGTILYVRSANLTANNFEVSTTLGGSKFTGFTTDGTALTVATSYRSVRTPTNETAHDKGCRIMGTAISRHYLVAFGPKKVGKMGAVQVLNGDRIKTTNAAVTGTVDNAHATPVGAARGKPSASAGTVQLG